MTVGEAVLGVMKGTYIQYTAETIIRINELVPSTGSFRASFFNTERREISQGRVDLSFLQKCDILMRDEEIDEAQGFLLALTLMVLTSI